jgi:hypothetical protein
MTRLRTYGAIFFVIAAVLGLLVVRDSLAQNFSGLQGQELQARQDSEADLAVLLGGLFNKDNKIDGTITRVIVTKDSERQLVLAVSAERLENKVLWGELRDQDGKRQAQILTAPVTVTQLVTVAAGTFPTELVFNLDEQLPKETVLESASVHLFAAGSAGSPPGLVRSYPVSKKWQMQIKQENLVTVISPQPIEEAASLTERLGIVAIPARKFTPLMMQKERSLVKPRILTPDSAVRIRPR